MTPLGAGMIDPLFLDELVGNGRHYCFRCGDSCDNLEHRAEGFLERFQERSLIGYRDGLCIVWNYLLYNRPDNPNQLLGWISAVEDLPKSELWQELFDRMQTHLDGEPAWLFDGLLSPLRDNDLRFLREKFEERTKERSPEPSPEPGTVTRNSKQEQGTTKAPDKPAKWAGEVQAVWKHYKTHRPKARVLSPGCRKAIVARFVEGFTVADLRAAIDGNYLSPHHCGQNPTGTLYHNLDLIVRTADDVERFKAFTEEDGKPVLNQRSQRTAAAAESYLQRTEATGD